MVPSAPLSVASEALTHARRLAQAGRIAEARAILDRAVASRSEPALAIALADLDLIEGRAARALARVEALALANDDALFVAAKADEALGRLESAAARLKALKARLPKSTAILEMQIGSVERKLGNLEDAARALESAIAVQPDLAPAHAMLADLRMAQSRPDDASEVLRRAVSILPRDTTLWTRLASVESHRGREEQALVALDEAVLAVPATAGAWRDIGYSYAEHAHAEQADRALDLASALDPGDPRTECHRAEMKSQLGDVRGALDALHLALQREPGNLRAVVSERLMLPQVYEDMDDLRRWRARFAAGLDELERGIGTWLARPSDVFGIDRNNFLLAYQGEDDRDLQRRYSAFLARLIGAARPDLRRGREITFDGRRRLRVGFVSTLFRESTVGRYFERWITGLDPARFERFVYHGAPAFDTLTQRLAASSEHFVVLRAGSIECAERILADALDVLVHPEVGMNALTYELSAMRLAPVQCAGWGHPVTTGSDVIDAYFTSDAMEPPNGQAHYVEPLVRLPGIGVSYAMPEAVPAVSREELGVGRDRHLYVCAQSLFKVHPEMDDLLADIVARDERAVLLFFHAMGRRPLDVLLGRLQRAFARRGVPARGQLRFLPRMQAPRFRAVLGAADVVLDTVHWSGGNTSIDAFSAGVPVVTLPGRFMRGRQTGAMLEMMGVKGLIAHSPSDYAHIAVDLASDEEKRRAIGAAIVERRAVLFDQQAPLDAFTAALLRLARGEASASRSR